MTIKEFGKLLKTGEFSFYDGANGKTCVLKLNGVSFSCSAPVGSMPGRKLRPFIRDMVVDMAKRHFEVESEVR